MLLENEDKIKRYNKLAIKLKQEWINLCTNHVSDKIPTDCGVLEVSIKGNDTFVIIFIDDTKQLLRRIEVDNKHIWDYIVNELYMNKPKVVNLCCDHKGYVPLTFDDELYNKLDEIYNDEELNLLNKEIFAD